ncbi:MAG: hypothetical protein IJ930_11245 [Lachnospiraceae bacterium]|nr:hypothetical protein [Lachnospiraceae bacterium]
MNPLLLTLIIILVVLTAGLIVLYFVGRRMQKKQEEHQAQIQAMKQPVTMLVIDKKIMKLKEAGLPQAVIDQTPKYLRRSRVPVVKAKVGPQTLSLIADQNVYDIIPTRTNVKAMVSGIYIVEVKSMKGGKPLEKPTKKKGFLRRTMDSLQTKAGAKPVK